MPMIPVDISGHTEGPLFLLVRDSDTIADIMDRISARIGVHPGDLHIASLFVYPMQATPEEEADAIPGQEDDGASAPDVSDIFSEVEPMSQRPPAGQELAHTDSAGAATEAPAPGAASSSSREVFVQQPFDRTLALSQMRDFERRRLRAAKRRSR